MEEDALKIPEGGIDPFRFGTSEEKRAWFQREQECYVKMRKEVKL